MTEKNGGPPHSIKTHYQVSGSRTMGKFPHFATSLLKHTLNDRLSSCCKTHTITAAAQLRNIPDSFPLQIWDWLSNVLPRFNCISDETTRRPISTNHPKLILYYTEKNEKSTPFPKINHNNNNFLELPVDFQ